VLRGTPPSVLLGVYGPYREICILFLTKISDFPHPFSDLNEILITHFGFGSCTANYALKGRLYVRSPYEELLPVKLCKSRIPLL